MDDEWVKSELRRLDERIDGVHETCNQNEDALGEAIKHEREILDEFRRDQHVEAEKLSKELATIATRQTASESRAAAYTVAIGLFFVILNVVLNVWRFR